MKIEELFERCVRLAEVAEPTADANRYMHETLVLCCAEGLRDSGQAYGNVFSQVDYLCKRHGVRTSDRIAIQTMRRHSNHPTPLSREDLMYDVRALCLLISAVFSVDIPGNLVRLIPTENKPSAHRAGIDRRYVRCIVSRWDDQLIYADTDDGEIAIDYTYNENGADFGYLKKLLCEGMQLNLLDNKIVLPAEPADCGNKETDYNDKEASYDNNQASYEGMQILRPGLVVVEPDFMVDISAIARCFTDYGHHPLLYTTNRLKKRAVTQPILLGNFAGTALDGIINSDAFQTGDAITNIFREQALQFSCLNDFNGGQFKEDASQQVGHIQEAVQVFFSEHDRHQALLEPSFVCERLGLQGRVDLMTADMKLLVEQKAGKNMNIEHPSEGNRQREDHYVQLLLYYGVLRYNFGISDEKADIRLLYSKYPACEGLVVVNFYRQLFRDAIKFRNQAVATEYMMAREGFGKILPHLALPTIYGGAKRDTFFTWFIEPELLEIERHHAALTPFERAYYTRMMTFVYREQLYAKVGSQEGKSTSVADLWNMPLHEKRDTGNIYTDLTIIDRQQSAPHRGYDVLTFAIPEQGSDFLPNFRRNDMVYLYASEGEPDVCKSILYKGTIAQIGEGEVVVRLNDGQQNPNVFPQERKYVIEHGDSDLTTTSNIRSLHELMSAQPSQRNLLLGQRAPEADTAQTLSKNYHPDYDEVLLKAKQAKDYFLLIGPPGTGKTSKALRYMVEEALTTGGEALLLLSYTNRAVDEICAMLSGAGFDYVRIGRESSCDPRFACHLLEHQLGENPKLDDVRRRLSQVPIIVGTTSMIQANASIFALKPFGLAIIDEASQILEPNLVGILSSVRKFILIGDHKQLPAVVQQPEAESKVADECLQAICLTDCRHSLFERLLRWERKCGREQFVGVLRKQGRMHPAIAEFPCRMFYAAEQLEPVPCEHQQETSLGYDLAAEDALDERLKAQRMLFIPSEDERGSGIPCSDKANLSEARIVADLLRRIHRFYGERFDADTTVGVIVPYRNQIAMIRKEAEKLGIAELAGVTIDTVERYQGSQRDVIIYSFTVSHGYQLDFLTANSFEEEGKTIDRKLNVAITRARCQLLLTGNERILRQNAIFNKLINFCK